MNLHASVARYEFVGTESRGYTERTVRPTETLRIVRSAARKHGSAHLSVKDVWTPNFSNWLLSSACVSDVSQVMGPYFGFRFWNSMRKIDRKRQMQSTLKESL